MTTKPFSSSLSSQGALRRCVLQAFAGSGLAALLSACGSRPSTSTPSSGSSHTPLRRMAAEHIYQLNSARIYPGKLPPMLYAIGVLQVDLQPNGQIRRLHWMRVPRHAPEVVREIERTVHAAAPFPVTPGMRGALTYTDTWLWDKSGRFQLDTFSPGQLGN